MFSDAVQRMLVDLVATYVQLLTISEPLYVNLNLNVESGSSQVAQVPQVTGHAADTPAKAQRFLVSFLPTHTQDLAIFLAPLVIFNLKPESTHLIVGP